MAKKNYYTVLAIHFMDKEDKGYHAVHKIVCMNDTDKYVKSAIYGFISKDIQDYIKIKEYKTYETNSLVINPSDLYEAIQLLAIHYVKTLFFINRMNDYYKYKENLDYGEWN